MRPKLNINYKKHKKLIFSVLGGLSFVVILLAIFGSDSNSHLIMAQELKDLTHNIRQNYQNRPDYWGLNTQVVLDKNIAPSYMQKNNQITSRLGNLILIGNGKTAQSIMPTVKTFDVIYTDIDQKRCVELASGDYDQQFWIGISGLSIVTENKQYDFLWSEGKYKLPIAKHIAKEICSKNNVFIWHNE